MGELSGETWALVWVIAALFGFFVLGSLLLFVTLIP